MTNVGALKGLYTAMGGQADDVAGVKTNAGMITALQSVAAGGGAPVIATFSFVDNGWVCNKRYSELFEAFNAGTAVYGQMEGSTSLIPLKTCDADSSCIVFEQWTEPVYNGDSSTLEVTYYAFNVEDGGENPDVVTSASDAYTFANVTSANSNS